MSDEKVTEREAVMRERTAFVAATLWLGVRYYDKYGRDAEAEAERRYPLPTITRPRVVNDPDDPQLRWSVRGGAMLWRHCCDNSVGEWKYASFEPHPPTPERAALWADLYANPTEEVEG